MTSTLSMLSPLLILLACSNDSPKGGGGTSDTGTWDGGTTDTMASSVEDLGLVPLPQQVTLGEGAFLLVEGSVLRASGEAAAVAELLAASLRPATGFALPVAEGDPATGDIVLSIDTSAGLQPEGYALQADDDAVVIQASDAAGLFYGTQTLRQLLPTPALSPDLQTGVEWQVPEVLIEDAPTYSWRGGMIDVARHFFDAAAIERQIDLYALHKLNRLHLHLTDDQGWRIEIESWPDLALIGGLTEVGGGTGGFYTQDEYTALVNYAADRHVVIVPEIDFPGHANAALASYAELNADGTPEEPYIGEWVITTPLWLDGPATWQMVEEVWTEVAAITPGPWVHVGGDEAIDLTEAEYAEFMLWLHDVVDAQGKILVGWDEIGLAGLVLPNITQYWWNSDQALDAAEGGADLIYSYASDCYLDMKYDSSGDYGQTWAGTIDVQDAYGCEPGLAGVDAERFIGVEAPLWTEFVDTEDKVDFMIWPRLSAVAEVGWTPQDSRDWEGFRHRLGLHGARLDKIGVAYNPSSEIDWSE